MNDQELNNINQRQAFSERFQKVLLEKNIQPCTQAKLAQTFNVTPKSIRRWLEGSSLPNQYRLLEISKILGVRVEWFLYGTGNTYVNQSITAPDNSFPPLSEKELIFVAAFRQLVPEKQNCLLHLFEAIK